MIIFSLINQAQAVVTLPDFGNSSDIGSFISSVYSFSLGIVGIIVFARFIYAGFLYFTSYGNTSKVGKANTVMQNSVIALILLFSAYLILYVINPDLVSNSFTFGLGP